MNNHFRKFAPALMSIILVSCAQKQEPPKQTSPEQLPFRNTSLSVDKRVDDLMARLTMTEKIAQMFNDAPAIERLGIPPYNWWNEALHGVARAGDATVFPQAVGLASTFDEDLMLRIATVISDEGRAKHHDFISKDVHAMYTGLTFWSPNINIFRDPRWGRGQETYGEDPYLTGRMGINFVRGLQGDDPSYLKSVATIKHYAVHSGPEKTRHSDDYHPSRKDLYETYLPAFETVIKEAKVESLMCAYNAVSGAPACGNSELMLDILRRDMGFDGYVVSDCGAVADFYESKSHAHVPSPAEAAALGVKNGTDLNCGDHHGNTYTNLHYALYRGLITEEEIDVSVRRLMRARMRLGMFDPLEKQPTDQYPIEKVASPAHLALSQEAAEKSLVLLKNDGVLPLKPGVKVAVIGPNATNKQVLLGNYHGRATQPVTALQGIIDHIGEDNVHYAPGTSIIDNIYAHHQPVSDDSFFHYDNNGKLQRGLKAHYYKGHNEWNLWGDALTGKPDMTRIEPSVNMSWAHSPFDANKIEEDFAVIWRGIFKPEQTACYNFSGSVQVGIEGKDSSKPMELTAGKEYKIDARYTNFRTWYKNALASESALTWLDACVDLEKEALATARKADVVIYMGGIDANLEGEEMAIELDGFTGGDRTHIKLPANQSILLKALKDTGKPIVMVNFSGSAMALNWEAKNLNAIIQAFYPGEKAGTALANILWGKSNPSGRLPITFYQSVKDLPAFTDYTMKNRTYKYYQGKPLYPFGHGLSYSSFAYNDLKIPAKVQTKNGLTIQAKLKNTSQKAGEEVSQLYISLLDIKGTPIRELKGFKRTALNAQQESTIEFSLPAEQLRYIDSEGNSQAYTGKARITIGSGQKGYVSNEALVEQVVTFQ